MLICKRSFLRGKKIKNVKKVLIAVSTMLAISSMSVCAIAAPIQNNGVNIEKVQTIGAEGKLEINSFTGGHANHVGEIDEKAQLGETIKLTGDVKGATKYSFRISPRSAFPGNNTVEYNDLTSPEFNWTPKYEGIYAVTLVAEDFYGDKVNKTIYFQITK